MTFLYFILMLYLSVMYMSFIPHYKLINYCILYTSVAWPTILQQGQDKDSQIWLLEQLAPTNLTSNVKPPSFVFL